jgi:hypothetical protein
MQYNTCINYHLSSYTFRGLLRHLQGELFWYTKDIIYKKNAQSGKFQDIIFIVQ